MSQGEGEQKERPTRKQEDMNKLKGRTKDGS